MLKGALKMPPLYLVSSPRYLPWRWTACACTRRECARRVTSQTPTLRWALLATPYRGAYREVRSCTTKVGRYLIAIVASVLLWPTQLLRLLLKFWEGKDAIKGGRACSARQKMQKILKFRFYTPQKLFASMVKVVIAEAKGMLMKSKGISFVAYEPMLAMQEMRKAKPWCTSCPFEKRAVPEIAFIRTCYTCHLTGTAASTTSIFA